MFQEIENEIINSNENLEKISNEEFNSNFSESNYKIIKKKKDLLNYIEKI